MTSKSQRQDEGDRAISALTTTVNILNVAKDVSVIPPAQAAFAAASALLTVIRDTTANKKDNVDVGLYCAEVCRMLERGLGGRRLDEISQPALDAINELTATLIAIRHKVERQEKRSIAPRVLQASHDKDKIAGWKQDLGRILQVFNTELTVNTNFVATDTNTMVTETNATVTETNAAVTEINTTVTETNTTVADTKTMVAETNAMVTDIHRRQQGVSGWDGSPQSSIPVGESPPPAPKACLGREGVIEEAVGLAQKFESIALIGSGGIGKTSIALSVLHHDRIKERFGVNRRFISCDQFPPSRPHLLARLSRAIGAGVENPDDLEPLRPLLSSTEIFIVLDNAESILDPQGPDARREISAVVDELCQFKTVCVCITSRITTVPPYCRRPKIPTLSMEAAREIFYGIYDGEPSNVIDDLLRHLDLHALSITLLATTAFQNTWDHDQLMEEWNEQRAQVLQTDNESLAAAIELSLTSPTFRELGPDARDLLGVVAFFPQGIDRTNLDWLLPGIPNLKKTFDKFCALSLAHRSGNFITMLAPLRESLRPQDPKSSQLLCMAKDSYFSKLSVDLDPVEPGFTEARWIASEDLNVEYLLDIFMSVDANSSGVWEAFSHFIDHLRHHKIRQTILGPKIEALPDDHPSKSTGLRHLASLFGSLGNFKEKKRLLSQVLKLEREKGDDRAVAFTLKELSATNRRLDLHKEGIKQGKEALEIYERLGDTVEQAWCLDKLAWLLFCDGQLDASKEAASRAINLAPEKGQEILLCESHRVLGRIYRSRGNKEKAIHHFETALQIASPLDLSDQLVWTHHALAMLFCSGGRFNKANAHIKQAKSHATGDPYHLACMTEKQAIIWHRQHRLKDAKAEILCAKEMYERLALPEGVENCRGILSKIEQASRK